MNRALKSIITVMLNKKYIGKKHTPEEKLINTKTKWLQVYKQKDFKELTN